METFYQIAGVAVVTAVLCTVQRHSDQAGVTALVLLFGVLALIAAARLVVTEDESLYNALMRDYRAWLEALDVPFWTETTKVADVYGGRE